MKKNIEILIFVILNLFQQSVLAQDQRIWATYYGGESLDYGYTIATDASGNIYIAGKTISNTNLASGGFQNTFGGGDWDAFLVKFDSDGNRLWATYYGGPDSDEATSIASDIFGNVYLAGTTWSISGIASDGFQNIAGGNGNRDAFLVKFDSGGNRIWSTYYGGSSSDYGYDVATDSAGNVYLSGRTSEQYNIASMGFQNTIGGGSDAFLVKFDSSGNRIWATYYGGPDFDESYSVAIDASGNVYLAGRTRSSTDIATNVFQSIHGGGTYDAFLVKFDSSGNRLWATYYGDIGDDHGYDVTLDASGNVYLSGKTNSEFNIASGGFQNIFAGGNADAFLVKFNPSGSRIWATYYGGEGHEDGIKINIATDYLENVYLAASTRSTIGIAAGGFQNSHSGSNTSFNDFLVKFDSGGVRLSATYYGQFNEQNGCVAVDGLGNIYLSGNTQNSVGLAYNGFQDTIQGIIDAFLVKFNSYSIPININTVSATANCNGQCIGTSTVYASGGIPPYLYNWQNGQTTQTATGLCAGNYSVLVQDSQGDTTTANITIIEADSINVTITTSHICESEQGWATTISTAASQDYTYIWNTNPIQMTDTAFGLYEGVYTLTINDSNGCSTTQLFELSTIDFPISITQNGDTLSATAAPNYQWYYNGILIPGATQQNYVITESGNYNVETVYDSCTFIAISVETSCLCVGINENIFFGKISIYPIPANSGIIVDHELQIENCDLKITNISGEIVYQSIITNPKSEIDITSFNPGLYYITLQSYEGVAIRKFEVIR